MSSLESSKVSSIGSSACGIVSGRDGRASSVEAFCGAKKYGGGSVVLNIAKHGGGWVEVAVVYGGFLKNLHLCFAFFGGFLVLKLIRSCSSSNKLSKLEF